MSDRCKYHVCDESDEHDETCTDWPKQPENEIDSLRQQLATTERLLAELQARENKLRDEVFHLMLDEYSADNARRYVEKEFPSDSTALDAAIAKEKREVLLEAVAECEHWQNISKPDHKCGSYMAGVLQRMADKLKGGEQG